MHALGFVLTLLLGFSLGALGAGGSILSVPILVYLFKINPELATAYSLIIVGFVALTGVLKKIKSKEIFFSQAFSFALCTSLGVFIARKFIIHSLALEFNFLNLFSFPRRTLILSVFSIVMLSSSFFMLKSKKERPRNSLPKKSFLIYPFGLFLGTVAGFVGAGGGFLIVPSLNLLMKFPIKNAISTSLFVIAFQSLLGVLGEWENFLAFDFLFIGKLVFIAILGMLYGQKWSKKSSAQKLKRTFGYFIFGMAVFILLKEFTSL